MISWDKVWYKSSGWRYVLWPLSLLYRCVVSLRYWLYRCGFMHTTRLPVPLIVVGNITVGGTGKSPLVAELARRLGARGIRVGLVSRGYGGRAKNWPQLVNADSDPSLVGDEAVMLAQQTQCPMVVGPKRALAAQLLLDKFQVDCIISDDGMQHYALQRDINIALIDACRGFGNGLCLPAGPLRAPQSHLADVDVIAHHSIYAREDAAGMYLEPKCLQQLSTAATLQLDKLVGRRVIAVTGIGNPQRFFSTLARLGCIVEEHVFPDHHVFKPADIDFGADAFVVMTAKDAVKCIAFATNAHWSLSVTAVLNARLCDQLNQLFSRFDLPCL